MRETIAEWAFTISGFLFPIAMYAFIMVALFALPLALFRRTRPYAAQGLSVTSYVVGAVTWFFGAGLAFATFGWLGLFVGVILMGVGVVFIGILGSIFTLGSWGLAFSLVAMVVLTYALRAGGAWLVAVNAEQTFSDTVPESQQ